jgi:sortase A
MRDKRPVDELSIEELERILAIRKREARLARLRRYEGRRINAPAVDATLEESEPPEIAPQPPKPARLQKQPPAAPVYEDDDSTPRFEDELDARRSGQLRQGNPDWAKVWWNRLLLVVEIAAALGLVYLAYSLFQSLQEVTQVSANIQAQYQATASARLIPPTATPIINMGALVLPVGHTVSINDKGEVQAAFNLDEVPAQYRDQFAAMLSQPLVQPTPSPEGPIRIQIPKLKVDSTVVSGDSWQALQLGVGHHEGSANPGQRGNMVLSAHNDVYGEIFRHLDQLEPGDTITVSSTTKDYVYVVQDRQIVRPDEVWVMNAQGDERKLTLISCYPYRVDTKRIVVFATLQP